MKYSQQHCSTPSGGKIDEDFRECLPFIVIQISSHQHSHSFSVACDDDDIDDVLIKFFYVVFFCVTRPPLYPYIFYIAIVSAAKATLQQRGRLRQKHTKSSVARRCSSTKNETRKGGVSGGDGKLRKLCFRK